MFGHDFSLTKRHLGLLASLGGGLGVIVILAYDSLGTSDPDAGFGPMQRIALIIAFGVLFVGLSLLPLGDKPA